MVVVERYGFKLIAKVMLALLSLNGLFLCIQWSTKPQWYIMRHTSPKNTVMMKSSPPLPVDDKQEAIHIVFSTACNQGHAELLTLNIQNSAIKVGHYGPITRMVSGCTESQKSELLQAPSLYHDFRLHFTPDYSKQGNESYSPYNKPFSLRHWLRNSTIPIREKIIALVDVDFIFFKPLRVNTVENVTLRYVGDRNISQIQNRVEPGRAIAQNWQNYLGSGYWGNPSKIDSFCKGKPCANVTADEAAEYYTSIGPPYIMHIDDMQKFADDYCDFVVQMRSTDKGWMVEMFAFGTAAANHKIRFTRLTDLGITTPTIRTGEKEYWTFVDELTSNPCLDVKTQPNREILPVGLHICQKYENQNWLFYKYALPGDLLNCDSLRLKLPPSSTWEGANTTLSRGMVWSQCTAIHMINDMLLQYKMAVCIDGFNTHTAFTLLADKEKETREGSALPGRVVT